MNASFVTDYLDIWTSAIEKKTATGRGSNGNGYTLYGIKKLRELILELAVRGKLVPQDPNDEPALVLLERIAAEKGRLIKEGKIKKLKKLPDTEEAPPFNLPENWQWQRLSDIGIVASSRRVHQKDWTKSGVPFYRAREIVQLSKHGAVNNELFITEKHFNSLSTRGLVPETNDLMITGVGTIGEPYIVRSGDRFYFKDASVLIFKNYFSILPQFLFYFFKSPFWIKAIHEGSMGTTVHTLTISRANVIPIPVPPTAEQHRIVAKVDELMSLCDQLEQQTEAGIAAHQTLVETVLETLTQSQNAEELAQNWNRISNHFDTLFTTEHSIDQLKQTILQLAVMGKLVPQDPNDQPASVLLEKIAAEKEQLIKDKKIKKQKTLPEISNSEKPYDLPDGWEWRNLNELFAVITDGDHQPPPKVAEGIPFLVIGNLNSGSISFSDCRFVPENYYNSLNWGRKPLNGDILYTVTGSYGISINVNTSNPFCVQRHVAILKSVRSTPIDYLKYMLQSKYSYEFATNVATGIAQKTVPLSGLRKMPAAIPPSGELCRIVNKVGQLYEICDQIKSSLGINLGNHFHLTNAIINLDIN